MRLFSIILSFLTTLISLTAFGQIKNNTYKSLFDTRYSIGDKILSPKIYFKFSGGSPVLPEHQDSVRIISDFLLLHPNFVIEIGAHTDSRGNAEDNQKLSELRAQSVKYLLQGKFGIQPERIIIKGYGESEPLVPDAEIQQAETEEQKEQLIVLNRRVEIKIIKN